MTEVFKVAGWLLFSAVKFLIAPGSIYVVGGYSFWETIIISITGGWFGITAFFYFGKVIFRSFEWLIYRLRTRPAAQKKKVTRMKRWIVNIKNHRLGLVGLALVTPSMISIPVGCILAAKYFSHDKRAIPILFMSVVFWAFVLTLLASFFNFQI